ncbi:hypothetical protein BOO71_0004264 [Deinococcus marmoris]|uniref:Uncharacterized protein n=1 Tax=Deinococcus marmoris TaxID=249408 RepID=A0A1U7P1A6_9DEIO|nr:hypothetical protein BOO71_0004264 [Deinococcus marmoris]
MLGRPEGLLLQDGHQHAHGLSLLKVGSKHSCTKSPGVYNPLRRTVPVLNEERQPALDSLVKGRRVQRQARDKQALEVVRCLVQQSGHPPSLVRDKEGHKQVRDAGPQHVPGASGQRVQISVESDGFRESHERGQSLGLLGQPGAQGEAVERQGALGREGLKEAALFRGEIMGFSEHQHDDPERLITQEHGHHRRGDHLHSKGGRGELRIGGRQGFLVLEVQGFTAVEAVFRGSERIERPVLPQGLFAFGIPLCGGHLQAVSRALTQQDNASQSLQGLQGGIQNNLEHICGDGRRCERFRHALQPVTQRWATEPAGGIGHRTP